MDRLEGRLRHYDWGSRDALSGLRGSPPSGRPEAELWFGAHPAAPSTVDRGGGPEALDAVIAASQDELLGAAASLRGGELPFLVKLLAAERPLSIQAHPDRAGAAAGHAVEVSAGVPIDAPDRSFPDPHHKPELIVALTPFRALCGFRPVGEALEVAATLGLPPDSVAPLGERGSAAWPEVVGRLLATAADDLAGFVDRCGDVADGPWAATAALAGEVAALAPGDPAVTLVPLLVEHRLGEGEALFLDAGVLHAYLGGMAFEVMAASDNVLRAGLTTKHVDVDGLVGVLDPGVPPAVVQRPSTGVHRYDAPVEEFAVWRLAAAHLDVTERFGPEIVVGLDGSTRVSGPDEVRLGPGEAVWVPVADGPFHVDADGLAYRVTVGDRGF